MFVAVCHRLGGCPIEEAVARMLEALAAFRIEGVKTTIGLHEKLLSSKAFQQGELDTGYLEEHLEEILRG